MPPSSKQTLDLTYNLYRSDNVIAYKEAFVDEEQTLCIVMEIADNGDL